MNATNYAENAIGSALFLGVALPAISSWAIALYTTQPDETGSGGIEVSGAGYARQQLAPGANWAKRADQDTDGRTVFYNAVAVQFPMATADWGTITHFALINSTGSVIWMVAPLTESKTIISGNVLTFFAGQLEVAIG